MSLLIPPDAFDARRGAIAGAADLVAVRGRLRSGLAGFIGRPLYVPEAKAMLSRWGSLCRDDGAELGFDPASPHAQRCTLCGRLWSTEASHRWWVYWYQLWLAERVWIGALLGGLGDDAPAEARALEALAAIAARYATWPNADNVLGPSRPFFSTYLESIWVLQLAAAASLLEERRRLPADLARDLRARLFAPSAALIADFEEGRSNRQVWNAAALYALGRALGDAGMARDAAHGASGILASLEGGLLEDGLWYEGENYHWFALRGLVWGAQMLRAAGDLDLWTSTDPRAERFRAAFRAPVLTVLPDFTFPARRDSKFGVSLRQRRMAELWEVALARAPEAPAPDAAPEGPGDAERFASLLAYVYDPALAPAEAPEGEITEVERAEAPAGLRRDRLGWKALLWMSPRLPDAESDAWRPGSVHLEATGLAIFRDGAPTYVSLDYGEPGGGHGHPDRLNLTVHAGGIPWLVDFGTGSYISPSLAWYRTTAAHNAPLLDGVSQATAHGVCVACDARDGFGWVCAQLPDGTAYDAATIQRTVVVTPGYTLDVVQMGSEAGERTLALPWHGLGRVDADAHGLRFTRPEGVLRVLLSGRQPLQIQMARAPGPPVGVSANAPADLPFPIVVSSGEEVTLVACVDAGGSALEVECVGTDYLVRLSGDVVHTHRPTDTGWQIDTGHGDPIELGGLRDLPQPGAPPVPALTTSSMFGSAVAALDATSGSETAAVCPRVDDPPALDGSLDGFRVVPPLALDRADQFRRAEEPWEGAEAFSARAYLNTGGGRLFVGVDVTAPDPCFRPNDAPDPERDNEPPDLDSDGIQLYLETAMFYGWLIVPDPADRARLRVSAVRGTDAEPEMIVEGAWAPTPHGYRVTLAVLVPEEDLAEFGFDLAVNRAREGRERRVGQLVWSGAKGTRLYLAGDRPVPGPLPRVRVE